MDKQMMRNSLLVICGGVAFYCLLQHLPTVVGAILWVLKLVFPFLLGGVIAFILNVPMRAIERCLFPLEKRGVGFRRPLALLLTLLAVVGVLSLASGVIIPGVADAFSTISAQLPGAARRLQKWLAELEEYLPILEESMQDWNLDWESLTSHLARLLRDWGSSLVSHGGGFIGGVVSGVSTFVIGLVFSFYILIQKEKLGRQVRQIL